jgi:NAD+ synthase
MSDAEALARDLGISYDVFEIDSIVEEILATYGGSDGSGGDTEEQWEGRYVGNTSARVRITLNYLVANHGNELVVGTGNRAKLATGYVMKFGDGGVDCNPLGNLYKQQVRQVGAHLGVGENLVQEAPTGGMIDYGTDEEEFGVEYDTLDAVLALHVDGGVPAGATARITDITEEDVERIVEMHEASDHERTPPTTPKSHF